MQPQLIYALLPQATKKGYATEASNRILEYCFKNLDYQYLLASCDKPNRDSQKVAQSVGMREIEEKIIDDKPVFFFKLKGSRESKVRSQRKRSRLFGTEVQSLN